MISTDVVTNEVPGCPFSRFFVFRNNVLSNGMHRDNIIENKGQNYQEYRTWRANI